MLVASSPVSVSGTSNAFTYLVMALILGFVLWLVLSQMQTPSKQEPKKTE